MTDSSLFEVGAERCEDYDFSGGRCQLRFNHEGQHAADIGGTCLTWSPGEVHHWRMYPAPTWLIALPWAPGYQPAVRDAARPLQDSPQASAGHG
jgi:hypothetical protein